MVRPIPLSDGRFTVPGNRWDLLSDMPPRSASVAVIVPYYNQPHELTLVLAALDCQNYPVELLQIVVADDGSDEPPVIPASRIPVSVVRQPDQGFRAAAARNLGAAAATAEVLCFLDADTIPERDYIRRITALPSLCPDALVVGRRRHADFSGWTPHRLELWWNGGPAPTEFDEPLWLSDGYRRSGDLLDIVGSSYRYIISSVMCCSAELFHSVGGFDESFVQYGGEDWDFAHRAMMLGAVLKHDRDAVAWHCGPDWALREMEERARVKNTEALSVVRVVPDPDARVPGLTYEIPEVVVDIAADEHGPGSLLATIGCFLELDVGMWVHGQRAQQLLGELMLTDPRIRVGPIPESVLRRCRLVITVAGRISLPRAAVRELVSLCNESGVGVVTAQAGRVSVTCSASWALNRRLRWSTGDVRTSVPADAALMSVTHDVPGDALRLVEVAPDHPC